MTASSNSANESFSTISVASIVFESAKRFPNDIAIVVDDQQITYRELWEQTRRYAGALKAQGVGPGVPVAVLIPNVPDFARVYYAILALGGIVVPIHALLKGREIEYVLRDSGAKTLICAAPLLEQGAAGAAAAEATVLTVLAPEGATEFARLEALAETAEPVATYEPCRPDQTATILYTSGTTGQPKGALGSHLALVEQTSVLLTSTFEMRRGDKIFGGLPLFHTFGQTVVLNAGLRAGCTVVLCPRFSGAAALDLLEKHDIDLFFGVPTMYMAMLEESKTNPKRSKNLRYGVSGGAALPVAVHEKFKEVFGVSIHEGYGLTETSPVASFNHVGVPPRPGTIGQPVWGIQMGIARPEVMDSIELLPLGELGEIVIRGHNLFKGYLNRPEATAEAVVDGWFRTGDLGTEDEDGYFTIVDRKKDMILRNGYNVYPREVEEVLSKHPEIVSVAVYGVPHEIQGQEIVAAVVVSQGSAVTSEEILAYAKEQLAAYKYPRIVELMPEFPLGPSGKILKRELVARHAE
ncbi:long-chain acyl-CoA synthetase [Neomicrococcus aestuarii]|uniref:Long-chain acyl-CoA synthetase n=1 Tax=Neomicrococcus aestuarii TaxID=556325 RepID=A0A7W8TU16_9MICC|nr:long-chain fatty acid--CoA ligase [Neomicrococcus aestuarii]MBB5512897.1 long-chain acyl-CoA synthetase [Neomicrococcus aestuarii]